MENGLRALLLRSPWTGASLPPCYYSRRATGKNALADAPATVRTESCSPTASVRHSAPVPSNRTGSAVTDGAKQSMLIIFLTPPSQRHEPSPDDRERSRLAGGHAGDRQRDILILLNTQGRML